MQRLQEPSKEVLSQVIRTVEGYASKGELIKALRHGRRSGLDEHRLEPIKNALRNRRDSYINTIHLRETGHSLIPGELLSRYAKDAVIYGDGKRRGLGERIPEFLNLDHAI